MVFKTILYLDYNAARQIVSTGLLHCVKSMWPRAIDGTGLWLDARLNGVSGGHQKALTGIGPRFGEVVFPAAAITELKQEFHDLSGLFPEERVASAWENFQGGTGNAIGQQQ